MRKIIILLVICSMPVLASEVYSAKELATLMAVTTCVKRLNPDDSEKNLEVLVVEKAKSRGFADFTIDRLDASMKYYSDKPEMMMEYTMQMMMEVNACVQASSAKHPGKKDVDGVPTYEGSRLIEDNGFTYRTLTNDSIEKVVNYYRGALQKYEPKEEKITKYRTVFSVKINNSNRQIIIEEAPDGTDITIM